MILLIGDVNDPHLISIRNEIRLLGQESVILDSSQEGLLKTDFMYCSDGNKFMIKQRDVSIDLQNISTVFCASPIFARKGFVSSQEKDFWYFTWRESLYGYFMNLSTKLYFINKSVANAISSQNKIIFFNLAENLGINTPRSLITNNKEEIQAFLNSGEDILIKTMHQIYLEYSGKQTMMLVKKVNASQFDIFETEGECPVFLQHAVNKKYDIRVIIIGEEIFACKIDASQSDYGRIDWRAYDLPKTKHSIYVINGEIKLKLLELMKNYHLDYACLDLCKDYEDNYWLLDVNPFGKYMWIELATGLPISREIARLLCKPKKRICDLDRI